MVVHDLCFHNFGFQCPLFLSLLLLALMGLLLVVFRIRLIMLSSIFFSVFCAFVVVHVYAPYVIFGIIHVSIVLCLIATHAEWRLIA